MTRATWIGGLVVASVLGSVMSVEASGGRPKLAQAAAARQAIQMMNRAGKAAAMQGAGPNGQKAVLARFDTNGDGQLDPQERQQARQAFQAVGGKGGLKGPGPGAPARNEVLKRFDQDGDGKLNDTERAAALKARDARQKN